MATKGEKYPRITITFLPNKINVIITNWQGLTVRRIQKSLRDVYREFNLLKREEMRRINKENSATDGKEE